MKDYSKITLSAVPEPVRENLLKDRVASWQGDIEPRYGESRIADRGEILAFDCKAEGEPARTVFALSLGELFGNTAVLPLLPQADPVFANQWKCDWELPSLYGFVVDTSILMSLTEEATGAGTVVGHVDPEACRWWLNYAINGNEDDQPAELAALRGELRDITEELVQWYTLCYLPLRELILDKFNSLDIDCLYARSIEAEDEESDPEATAQNDEPGADEPWRQHPDGRYHRADLWESGFCSINRCFGCGDEGARCDSCIRP